MLPEEVKHTDEACMAAEMNLKKLECTDREGRSLTAVTKDGEEWRTVCKRRVQSGEFVGAYCLADIFSCHRAEACKTAPSSIRIGEIRY